MINSFYIAWKYVSYNKLKTATIIACVTLIAFLPMALELLLGEAEDQLLSRAVTTPLVVGAKGSSLDLVMNTLYFTDEIPELIDMKETERLYDADLATPIPVYIRFHARNTPVVGTTLDYFEFRDIKIAKGRNIALLGDCVIGAKAAKRLGLKPGDSIVSSPENLFDLAGIYPLKMNVAGILKKSYTSDDLAIFVDLKTVWIIEGKAHGHKDVSKTQDASVILKRTDKNVTANAKLVEYTEITKENIDSFHFHGDPENFPVTAVIAVPHDDKTATILRGRYLSDDQTRQIVRPKDVVDGLLQNIFKIKNVLDAIISVVGFATILAIFLVFSLSLRLRQREIQTVFKIGCNRLTIARLIGAEITIIAAVSGALCAVLIFFVNIFANDLVRMLFM